MMVAGASSGGVEGGSSSGIVGAGSSDGTSAGVSDEKPSDGVAITVVDALLATPLALIVTTENAYSTPFVRPLISQVCWASAAIN
ncbi:MAG: hypothetical protein VW962_09435, partial [Acidimicrobiaceae bacterium]